MFEKTRGTDKGPYTDEAESIAIDARDVLAGHWDEIRMEAGR